MKQVKTMPGKFLVAAFVLFLFSGCTFNKENGIVQRMAQLDNKGELIVQMAELKIDPLQIDAYLKLLKEGIQTSVATEPGVLSLYAMADSDNPNHITVVEVYANQKAYEAHISSLHFQKYKNATLEMVDSLKLTRTTPVVFAAKPD